MSLQALTHLDVESLTGIERCLGAPRYVSGALTHVRILGEEMAACLRLRRDAADGAGLNARLLARGSAHAERINQVCAEVCQAASEERSRHDAPHCVVCAQMLDACVDACQVLDAPATRRP